MPFDIKFAIETALPLAVAAYTPLTPVLPKGWEKIGDITLTGDLHSSYISRLVVQDPTLCNFGIGATNGKIAAACCRGTLNLVEWVENADVRCINGVESGFWAMEQALTFPTFPVGMPIVVIGHSLGGPIGTIWMEQCKLPVPLSMYSFASPRVFSPTRARAFDAIYHDCYRIANVWDAVPKAPILQFKHIGNAIDINGGLLFNPDVKEVLKYNHKLVGTYNNGLLSLAKKMGVDVIQRIINLSGPSGFGLVPPPATLLSSGGSSELDAYTVQGGD